tara:strand:+ start:832 stop:1008 length:177 start_codon:yes stop_codon:yes gene_type:complete
MVATKIVRFGKFQRKINEKTIVKNITSTFFILIKLSCSNKISLENFYLLTPRLSGKIC